MKDLHHTNNDKFPVRKTSNSRLTPVNDNGLVIFHWCLMCKKYTSVQVNASEPNHPSQILQGKLAPNKTVLVESKGRRPRFSMHLYDDIHAHTYLSSPYAKSGGHKVQKQALPWSRAMTHMPKIPSKISCHLRFALSLKAVTQVRRPTSLAFQHPPPLNTSHSSTTTHTPLSPGLNVVNHFFFKLALTHEWWR